MNEVLNIDIRDLRNLMRNIFLCGFNEGLNFQPTDDIFDESERDETIEELIKEYQSSGSLGYNGDLGSKE